MPDKKKKTPNRTPMFSTEGLPPGFRFMDWDSDDFESHRMMFPKKNTPTPPPADDSQE